VLSNAGSQSLNRSFVPDLNEIPQPYIPSVQNRKFKTDKRAAGLGYKREDAYNIITNNRPANE
jgi:hypothetical protein